MFTKTHIALFIAATLGLSGCGSDNDSESVSLVDLRVLETSDLHTNIMDFNYYSTQEDPTIGLARTASLIHEARKEVPNSVLVDNGDLLQGSPMGDYMAKIGMNPGDIHPAYKAMNLLSYDVGNVGNHEFNYGLDFLKNSLDGAKFPYINANVYCADPNGCWDGKKVGDHLFTPYLIKETQVVDRDGNQQTIKIGYIGFVPPQILQWDKQNLAGKLDVKDIVETANKYVPEMKSKGADVIIAIPHSGIGSVENPGDPMAENATFALTYVKDIDAIMFGHSHSIFPSAGYADDGLPNTDVEKGLLNGVAAVMPGRWGDNLGVVDLHLERDNGKWNVVSSTAAARPIYDGNTDTPLVDADPAIHEAVAVEHQGTLDFVDEPIGVSSADMYSFLTLVQDDPTVQIVADSQIDKVKEQLPANLQGLPVLSAAAPFKAGGRHGTTSDADQYVLVDKGELTYKNAADLYLYPNTVVAVKVTGAELKDWLECSANQFNRIDPTKAEPQELINWAGHPTYNFDVIDGVKYKIDVTQPSKFDKNCKVVNATANRIIDLSYTDETGVTISGDEFASKEFVVASNNYRAFGGLFAGTGADHVVLELPDANRDVLAAYITEQSQPNESGGYDSMVNPSADYNWDFKTISASVDLDIRFQTQDSDKAAAFIEQNHLRSMQKIATDELGFAVYRIDLTK